MVDPRVRLVRGRPRPPGWIGKNWACHQLAEAATGDLLVFCDADVVLAPGALEAVWAHQHRQRAEVFSVFPRQEARGLGERMVVPLIDENLLAFLPHQLLDAPVPAAAVANGQLLAFLRPAYHVVGGHEAVASEIVEDLALGRRARRVGLKLGLSLGGDLVGVRMYDGYASVVAGMGKSMRAAHGANDVALVGERCLEPHRVHAAVAALGQGPGVAGGGAARAGRAGPGQREDRSRGVLGGGAGPDHRARGPARSTGGGCAAPAVWKGRRYS